jgi:hypothetical protein
VPSSAGAFGPVSARALMQATFVVTEAVDSQLCCPVASDAFEFENVSGDKYPERLSVRVGRRASS